jgi:hypothetical protein
MSCTYVTPLIFKAFIKESVQFSAIWQAFGALMFLFEL